MECRRRRNKLGKKLARLDRRIAAGEAGLGAVRADVAIRYTRACEQYEQGVQGAQGAQGAHAQGAHAQGAHAQGAMSDKPCAGGAGVVALRPGTVVEYDDQRRGAWVPVVLVAIDWSCLPPACTVRMSPWEDGGVERSTELSRLRAVAAGEAPECRTVMEFVSRYRSLRGGTGAA